MTPVTAAPPPGFEAVRAGSATAWIRPRAGRLREALEAGDTLHGAALTENPVHTLRGRGAVPVIEPRPEDAGSAGERWAVRHYRRGGAVASLLGDRYLRPWPGPPRPFRELLASEAVRARGIPTPEVVAAAVYPAGPFYRGDLVTVYVPDSADLAEILFGDGWPVAGPGAPAEDAAALRHHALLEAGHLIQRMAAAGVRHPDLNAKNLLFSRAAGAIRIHLLDLDRCDVVEGSVDPAPMRRRLARSLEKLGAASGRPLDQRALGLLAASSSTSTS